MTKPRVIYSWPTGDHPKPAFVNSLSAVRMGVTLADHRMTDIMCATGPVQMARTKLCAEAVTHGCDFLVMHDDDLAIGVNEAGNPIDNSIRIMQSDPNVGIVGAVYLREHPPIPTMNLYHPDHGYREHCSVVSGLPKEPFQVGGVGFGWVMIRVEAIKALARMNDGPLVRFSHGQDVAGLVRELGEDYDFCDRINMLGYKVIADPRYRTDHYKRTGVLCYDHDEHEKLLTSNEHQIALGVPDGTKLIEIRGMTCIDTSGARFKEAAAIEAARKQAELEAAKREAAE